MDSDSDFYYCDADDYYSDEIDNSDSVEEFEDDSDGIVDSILKKKIFTILKEEDIRLLQEDAIANISDVLGVTKEAALILLLHHKWRIDDVNDKWFADQERVRESVGLLENPVVSNQSNSFPSCKKFFCKICLENLPMDKRISVSCGHPFCEECWREYIKTSINDGLGCLMLKCPEPSCGTVVGRDMIDRLAVEEDKARYLHYLVQSYVEENEKMKWCPAPGCDRAVEFVFGSEIYDVTCSCSHSFCWNCTEAAHRPVDCETVKKWLLKNSSAAENANWILINSKPCPNCKRPIEKNQGCMHMRCSMCKHEFCWLCLENWKIHGEGTGGFYSCNGYLEKMKKGVIDEDERKRQAVKESFEKFVHYSERWDNNHMAINSAKKGLKHFQDCDMGKLKAMYCQIESELSFILEAWEQIIECRRVLKWTYAYGYYLTEEEKFKKQFFEYLQGEAEAALEKLHHCTEKEILWIINPAETSEDKYHEFRLKLVDLTKVTNNYFQNLVKALEKGLADVQC